MSIHFTYATTGGTLKADTSSYIERRADTDLYHALQQREDCYILTCHQTGKSCLKMHVAECRPEAEKRWPKIVPQRGFWPATGMAVVMLGVMAGVTGCVSPRVVAEAEPLIKQPIVVAEELLAQQPESIPVKPIESDRALREKAINLSGARQLVEIRRHHKGISRVSTKSRHFQTFVCGKSHRYRSATGFIRQLF